MSLLWKPFSFGKYNVQTTLSQADVTINCDLTSFIQRQLFFWGSYEEKYCQHWMRLARQASIIFDVGANVGVYTLLAAAVNSQADIHAFEATPEIARLLKENIDLNEMKNIHVVPLAVGSNGGNGLLRSCRGTDNSNEGMNFVVAESTAPELGDQSIQIVSLDEYCRQMKIDHIDLLKIDIEGGEYDALLGAERLLNSHSIGCIFIEFVEWAANRSGHSTAELTALLLSGGYKLLRLGRSGFEAIQPGFLPDGENVIAFHSAATAGLLGYED
jgi:FkbM family methyltransferase